MHHLKLLIISLGFLSVSISVCYAQRITDNILQKSEQEILKLENWAYEAIYFKSPFNMSDTQIATADLFFSRNSIDTFLGFNILISTDSIGEFMYLNYSNIIIQHTEKSVYIEDPFLSKKKIYERVWFREMINKPLLQPKPYDNLINYAKLIEYKGISIIDDKPCHVIQFDFQVPKRLDKAINKYFIDTASYLPIALESNIRNADGQDQYVKVVFKNLRKTNINPDFYQNRLLPGHHYDTIYYKLPKKPGDYLPLFDLTSVTGDRINIKNRKYKIILLDFWSFSCRSCIQAMPYLQELYEKYEEEGLIVIGINASDVHKTTNNYIANYLIKKNISYPNILTSRDFLNTYQATELPTMYLINNDGRVIRTFIGFRPEEIEIIENKILNYIK